MTNLAHLISTLATVTGPALTWYGKERTELGGPVLARWLAKTSNLLADQFGEDLFGTSPTGATSRGLHLALGASWQACSWTSAARLSGWEVTGSVAGGLEVAPLPRLLVTDHWEDAFEGMLAQGVDVLLHDTAPLSLGWPGEVPPGAWDALGELMAQPDALLDVPEEVEWPSGSGADVVAPGSDRLVLTVPTQGDDVATRESFEELCATAVLAWEHGVGVVVIDPARHDAPARERILATEGLLP